MINITNKVNCCGCGACVQCCPKQCIDMTEDEEGFLYPKINFKICVDCGLCEKACPILNTKELQRTNIVLVAKNVDNTTRLHSSSGGLFHALAEHILSHGGVVFGAIFNDKWEVEHSFAEGIEQLSPLMRSKYVQSKTGNTYKQAEKYLKQGRQVLYVGTSCQIAGLIRYLRTDYENLLAVDVVCHGVPSPGVWRDYLAGIGIDKIKSVNFRAKQYDGYEWKQYGLVIKDNNDQILSSKWFRDDIFLKGFLGNLFLRPSCEKCRFKAGKSGSDLTLGDFWGIDSIDTEFADNIGVSSVFVHSQKGQKAISALNNIHSKPMSYEQAVMWNQCYYKSTKFNKSRNKFWTLYYKTHNLEHSVEAALYISPICLFIIDILKATKYNTKGFLKRIKRIICRNQ